MAALAIERYLKTSLTSGKSQSLPMTDRWIFRCLFFDKDYNRKLVSDAAHRFFWPLVRRPNRFCLWPKRTGSTASTANASSQGCVK
jgi:hypothetical protein